MTRDQWLDKLVEMEFTTPPADTDLNKERLRQMLAQIRAIRAFLWKGGPEPDPEWRMTVPDLSAEEKEALFDQAMEWWDGEWKKVGRMLDEMRAMGELPEEEEKNGSSN